MKKNVIRLNEGQLRRMISETVRRVLKESQNEFCADISGYELVEYAVWEVLDDIPDEYVQNVEGFVQAQNDPALADIYNKEYRVWAEPGFYDKLELTGEDDGLDETIKKIRDPKIREAISKAYDVKLDYLLNNVGFGGFENYTAAMRDYHYSEMAEPDYDL